MAALTYTVIALVYLLLLRGRCALHPGFLFLVFNSIMFYGIYMLHDPQMLADREHVWLLVLGMVAFLAGALLRDASRLGDVRRVREWWRQPFDWRLPQEFRIFAWGLVALSVAVCALYYSRLGYNLFLMGLAQGVQVENAADLRMAGYGADQYLAAGYVNQFKNMLLPLLSMLWGLFWVFDRRFPLRVLLKASPLWILTLVFILGTGQRGALVFAIFIAIAVCYASFSRKVFLMVASVVGSIGFALFIFNTLILQRSESTVEGLGSQIFDRVMSNNQMSSIVGYRYVREKPIGFAEEWITDILGILPNRVPSTLPNEINEIFYGTMRGTAPASVWVTAWYNAGIGGVVGFGLVAGFLFHSVHWRMVKGPRHLVRMIAYSAYFILLGTYVIGGALHLLNVGMVAVIMFHLSYKAILWIRARLAKNRNLPQVYQPLPRPASS